jgi:hypothetical protein
MPALDSRTLTRPQHMCELLTALCQEQAKVTGVTASPGLGEQGVPRCAFAGLTETLCDIALQQILVVIHRRFSFFLHLCCTFPPPLLFWHPLISRTHSFFRRPLSFPALTLLL